MAITLTSKKKSQKTLVFVFLISIVIIFIILYYQFFMQQEEPLDSDGGFENELDYPDIVKKITINTTTLDSILFLRLTRFPDPPATPTAEELGRENPFYPYETSSGSE